MTPSKKLLVSWILLLLVVVPALGSGSSDECDYFPCYSFFMPEIIGYNGGDQGGGFNSFFLDNRMLLGEPAASPDLQSVNREEWDRYFGGAIPPEWLSFLIYDTSIDDLGALSASLDDKDAPVPFGLQGLRDLFKGNKNRVVRSLQYLSLAKGVEPIAMADANRTWDSPPRQEPDAAVVQKLIETAERQVRGADKFLTQRYRFQVMRLLFYARRFEEAQKYFERYKGIFSEENSPKYRFIDLGAGAYYKDKKYGKANYLFSVVFDKFEPLKMPAYRSFRPMEDADWRETMSLARNNREREVLWQLLGMHADGIAAIDAIHAMNPKSKLLPLLLVREVNRIERNWTANSNRMFSFGAGGDNAGRADSDVVGRQRLARLQKIADSGKVDQPYLWLLATGHLFALSGDSVTAERYIRRAMESLPDDETIKAQARMSLLFARVRGIDKIDKTAEPWLTEELTWLQNFMGGPRRFPSNYRASSLNDWLLAHLRDVYRDGADPIRALLLTDTPDSKEYYSVASIDAILEFVREARTPFDRFLARNYEYSAEELHELRAINFLYTGNFSEAVEAFNMASGDTLGADPFSIHIRDCHQCDAETPHTTYTKLSFAERMLSLSKTAEGQGEPAALASFELANGLYNMSFYGNARDVFRTRHANFVPHKESPPLSSPSLRMDLPERYYLRAANLSVDREFKAKAVFMASKAEQNRRYTESGTQSGNNRTPGAHFRMLRDAYADTQYYQEIIRECGYFRSYVAGAR